MRRLLLMLAALAVTMMVTAEAWACGRRCRLRTQRACAVVVAPCQVATPVRTTVRVTARVIRAVLPPYGGGCRAQAQNVVGTCIAPGEATAVDTAVPPPAPPQRE